MGVRHFLPTSTFLVTIIVTLRRYLPVPEGNSDVIDLKKVCTNRIVSTVIQNDITLITPGITHIVGQQTEPSLTKSKGKQTTIKCIFEHAYH